MYKCGSRPTFFFICDYWWLLMIICDYYGCPHYLWLFYDYFMVIDNYSWLFYDYWSLFMVIMIIDNYSILFQYVNVACINADIGQLFFEKYLGKLIWLI